MSNPDYDDGIRHVREGGSSNDFPVGTPAHDGAVHEEYQRYRKSSAPPRATTSSAPASGDGMQGLAVLALPALYWPGLAMWNTWNYVAAQNPQWHPVYKFLPVLGEFVALMLAITWFYRYLPRFAAAVGTAAYLAFAYGYAAQHFLHLDQQWTGGIALVAALIGYSLGNAASERR